MKSAYLKKLAAGVLVAAMAVTAVPAVSQLVNPTVTAQAAKKKKKAKKTKNAKVAYLGTAFNQDGGVYVGKQMLGGEDLAAFSDYKASGKYTFTTNSKDLSIKLDNSSVKMLKDSFGKDWTRNNDYLSYDVTAKKPGTYKVTIKEKYKGKTRTLKKNAKLYVYEPEASSEECTAYIGDYNYISPSTLLSSSAAGVYNFEVVEGADTVLSAITEDDGDYTTLKPIAEGQAKVKITDLYGKDCGTATVTVKANHCAKIELSDEAYYYDDDDNQKPGISITRYSDETAQEESVYLSDYYDLYGEDEDHYVSDPVTITSSNPAVVSVSQTDSDEEGDEESSDSWCAAPQSAGDAVLTITCGSQSVQLPVHVKIYSDDED